jgi:serine/threonine-protein kinase
VLHRDVKPSNIFGSPQTGLRLGDFGLAVASSLKRHLPSGTLRFIAPEVLPRVGGSLTQATRRSDVYSLGATAYDLRYGRPPFCTREEIFGNMPAKFPEARTPEEAYFQHVLARMLERDPERRFPSMTAPRRLLGALARTLRPSLPATSPERGVFQLGHLRVICSIGDLADAEADGIVNSAKDDMTMTGGVGRALREKGGAIIEEEAMRDGSRALGEVIATTGGALACKHVLHAVSAWNEASCIARTCQRTLLIAEELGLRTLAIPALGTGIARVSPEACAYATGSALEWHVQLGGTRLREVRFVLYDQATYDVFVEELSGVFLGAADTEAVDEPLPPQHGHKPEP